MKRHWYDHKTTLCEGCVHYRPAGEEVTAQGRGERKEGCAMYGYYFHPYPELADECECFLTEAQYRARVQSQARLTKGKRR